MTIKQVSAKIDLRLNKSASADYDNIWSYAKQEGFQKAINELVRRLKIGKNQTQDGDEETAIRIDDLQILLKQETLAVKEKGIYVQTEKLPEDYVYFKRVTPIVSKGNCGKVQMKSHLREEANVDDLLNLPSFDFEETFHTIINDRIHIYHNKDFKVNKAELTYYRKPKEYDFKKLDTVVEFGDTLCDMLVDEACKIIASDLESINAKQLTQERAETNE